MSRQVAMKGAGIMVLLAALAMQGGCGRGEAATSQDHEADSAADSGGSSGGSSGGDSGGEVERGPRKGISPAIGQRCEVLLRFDVLAKENRPAIDPHLPFLGRSQAGATAGILGVLESVDEQWVVVLRQVEGELHRFHIPRSHVLLIRTW